ncbi:MAG TPA: GTP 3',8-cyclase MoaA [Acidobacteriota bacterium]|nr:GTP 3',8-cyclase MoaA [Acidobacteriota bacterium]
MDSGKEMLTDRLGRELKDIRISVTDRCNFRCTYCMPLDRYGWIDRREILTFEEITRLAGLLVGLGVEEIRITGGEPLLRHGLEALVRQLSGIGGLKNLSLTTNASHMSEQAGKLAAAGVQRVNVSLDTLNREKFRAITRLNDLPKVIEGLHAAKRHGMQPIKINSVIQRGVNDDDILELVEFSRQNGFWIRFIEFMDVGNSNNWVSEEMLSKKEMLEIIHARYPLEEIGRRDPSAPSVDYRFADGVGNIGVIASVTEPFCAGCARARLTADGRMVLCLFSEESIDLKTLLRTGADDQEILDVIRSAWKGRSDRYSEERLEAMNSGGYRPGSRKKIEMISLGG